MNSQPIGEASMIDQQLEITIGLIKGAYLGLEPQPTKIELLEELQNEAVSLVEEEYQPYMEMVARIEAMNDEECRIYFDSLAPLELHNDEIVVMDEAS